jgi:hypothetical protein
LRNLDRSRSSTPMNRGLPRLSHPSKLFRKGHRRHRTWWCLHRLPWHLESNPSLCTSCACMTPPSRDRALDGESSRP